MENSSAKKKIYSVSQLTHEIHETLDSNFAFVWVTGEISNFAAPSSGHFYFSLKDSKAVISAIIFKNQQKNLKFRPENGLEIIGFGRITVYPPRGTYQFIFEYIEPKGLGSMQLLFEQTKEKLKAKGLFDEKFKQKPPFLPSKISVVTSLSGAALKDILKTFKKLDFTGEIEIYPVSVQGEKSANEIIEAINYLNDINDSDVIIIARGGGSFEDLMPFNSEDLAMAVFNSKIPVISGVGHETDYTIIDFVSDLRAPTPTAAAEYSVPDKSDLLFTINSYKNRLESNLRHLIARKKDSYLNINKNLCKQDPETKIENLQIYIDDQRSVLESRISRIISYKKDKIDNLNKSISCKKIDQYLNLKSVNFSQTHSSLLKTFESFLNKKRFAFEGSFSKLYERGPYTVLKRGYSIARQKKSKKILRSVNSDIKKNDEIEVVLSDGILLCNVKEIFGEES